MGIPPLWGHLLKAYEHVNLPHLSNLYHTSSASPQTRLWIHHISTNYIVDTQNLHHNIHIVCTSSICVVKDVIVKQCKTTQPSHLSHQHKRNCIPVRKKPLPVGKEFYTPYALHMTANWYMCICVFVMHPLVLT